MTQYALLVMGIAPQESDDWTPQLMVIDVAKIAPILTILTGMQAALKTVVAACVEEMTTNGLTPHVGGELWKNAPIGTAVVACGDEQVRRFARAFQPLLEATDDWPSLDACRYGLLPMTADDFLDMALQSVTEGEMDNCCIPFMSDGPIWPDRSEGQPLSAEARAWYDLYIDYPEFGDSLIQVGINGPPTWVNLPGHRSVDLEPLMVVCNEQ